MGLCIQKQTSFFEQAIVYYLSKIYPDIKSRDKSYGIELDVFIPSKQIAIEYDGQLFHGTEKLESDENKNELCKKLGVALYRIRERDCGEIYGQYLMVGPAISEDDSANYIISTEWMEYYNLAEQYYEEHGHLIVEKDESYQDKDLGNWISNQRHYYNSKQTQLATQKVALLEQIGMAWNANDYKWEIGFRYAEQYYRTHGNLLVSSKYVVDGFQLGHWILNQRSKKTGRYKTSGKITDLQIKRLSSIGMVWNSLDEKWEIMFNLAKNYYEENGNLEIPNKYEVDGKKLGSWILMQRDNYKKGTNPNFTDEKIKKLESIGMKWKIGRGNVRPARFDEKWKQMYELLQKELGNNPTVKITKRYVTANGINLGQWVYRQKKVYQGKETGILDEDKIQKLKKLNII